MSQTNDSKEKVSKNNESLLNWTSNIKKYNPISWDRLPELDLYMDQVTTFLNRQLDVFSVDDEKMLTPSMINNYVKGEVVPRPERKKYNKEHLSMLMIICLLKSVLSLPEINMLLNGLTSTASASEIYSDFLDILSKSTDDMAKQIPFDMVKNGTKEEKYSVVLKLAIQSNMLRLAASKILYSIEDVSKNLKEEKKD